MALAALALIAAGCGSDDSGDTTAEEPAGETTTSAAEEQPEAAEMTLTSSVFSDGDELDAKYTCDGAGASPPLEVGGVPADAAELVLVLTDPDAPGGTFIHATSFGIDPAETTAPEGSPPAGAQVGGNDGGGGFFPPCPPEGDGPHRYVFTAYALSEPSGLEDGAPGAEVIAAAEAAELASAALTATYER